MEHSAPVDLTVMEECPPEQSPPSNDAPDQRSRSFDKRGSAWFLTYPRCPLDPDRALRALNKDVSDTCRVLYLRVARERHNDGGLHLHVLVLYSSSRRVRTVRAFDLEGYHPNIQTARNVQDVYDYVSKHGDFVEHGTYNPSPVQSNPRGARSDMVATHLRGGGSIAQVSESNPGFVLLNLAKIRTYKSWLEAQEPAKEPWPEKLDYFGPGLENLIILDWLESNIRQPRPFKAKQLWIHGGPDLGKTSLVNYLRRFLRIYMFPLDELFFDTYDDDYDLIVLDEFNAQVPITHLNKWLDGQHTTLRIKGGQIIKRKNLPVLILSNHSPADCYRNANTKLVFEALLTRLLVIEVTDPLYKS